MIRYGEEFAFSWHWIDNKIWGEALTHASDDSSKDLQRFSDQLGSVIQQELYHPLNARADSILIGNNMFTYLANDMINDYSASKYGFTNADYSEFQRYIHGVQDDGSDLPVYKILLDDRSLLPRTSINQGVYTAILSPIKIAEQLENKKGDIWQDYGFRKVCNYYRTYHSRAYSMILDKAIHIIKKSK